MGAKRVSVMRKWIVWVLVLLLFLSGCTPKEKEIIAKTPVTEEISVAEEEASIQPPQAKEDINLSEHSETMIYAEVFTIMREWREYLGTKLTIPGIYHLDQSDSDGVERHYLLVLDAAACCAVGVEFTWDAESIEEGSPLLLIGYIESYEYEGRQRVRVATEKLEQLGE